MLDQLSYLPAPLIEERVRDISNDPSLREFRRLAAMEEIIWQTTKDIPTGSSVGWGLFGRAETLKAANLRLLLYCNSIFPRFYLAVRYLIAIIRLQNRARERWWRLGGALYRRLQKKTRVGRKA